MKLTPQTSLSSSVHISVEQLQDQIQTNDISN